MISTIVGREVVDQRERIRDAAHCFLLNLLLPTRKLISSPCTVFLSDQMLMRVLSRLT